MITDRYDRHRQLDRRGGANFKDSEDPAIVGDFLRWEEAQRTQSSPFVRRLQLVLLEATSERCLQERSPSTAGTWPLCTFLSFALQRHKTHTDLAVEDTVLYVSLSRAASGTG